MPQKIKKFATNPVLFLPTIFSLLSIATLLLIFSSFPNLWKSQPAEAAGEVNIYYSVGQNTDDHKTGSPTITISGNTATFSVAQTATNMGVGDQISYGDSSATTTAYISGKTSSTTWSVITATGGIPTATTTATVLKIAHAFSSLAAAVGGTPGAADASHLNSSDLTSGSGYIMNIPCYYDSGSDTTTVTINGWTTATTTYIKIYTPYDTSAEVNQSQRHQGVYDSTKYNMDVTDDNCITINENYVNIEGLQLYTSSPTLSRYVIYTNGQTADNLLNISNNIIKGHDDAAIIEVGIAISDADVISKIWNNIVYDIPSFSNGSNRSISTTGALNYIYNNTIVGGNTGIRNAGVGTVVLKNNLVQSASDGYLGTFDASSDFNISDISGDTTSISSSYSPGSAITVTFLNSGSNDFHLDSSDAYAKDQGTVLKTSGDDSNLYFANDIDSDTRPDSSWDIGADEYVASSSDTTAPIISAVSSSTNPTTATITWTTDENASSTVYYGTTTSYGLSSTSDTMTTSHSINLSGLSGYTTYHFYVESTDAYGNTSSSSDYTFLTTDTTAPTVTAFTIPATSSSQTITITTFTASDTGGSGLAGYLINETASTPSLSDPSWETSATTTYTFSTDGSKTLYAWAKDNAGNISNSSMDTVIIGIVSTGTTYYINGTTGSDSDTGTSSDHAWATISKANSTLEAGDTVIIASGTYEEIINPTNSGSAGAYITYVAAVGERPIIRQVSMVNKDYIKIIGFEITHNSLVYNRAIIVSGCNYIEIINNYIHHVYGQAIYNSTYYGGATYITIRGNIISWAGCPTDVSGSCSGAGGISITGSNFFIEYNKISHTLDFVDTSGGYNIIRNNYFYDFSNSDFPDGNGDSTHVDTWQPYDYPGYPMVRSIFENNYATDNSEINSHFNQVRDEYSRGEEDAIVRGNMAVRFGSGNQWGGFDYARIYNNTFSDFQQVASSTNFVLFSNEDSGADVSSNCYFFNNVLYKAARQDTTDLVEIASGSSVTVSNNACEYGTDEGCSVTSNINFLNYDNDIFHLQSSSDARDSGRVVNTVTSATGSGTSFTVDDAGFFVGGTGIINPLGEEIYDTIKVGSSSAVKITSLDLNTNTITVASSISWNNGDSVVLSYQDSTPDIGAYQYKSDYSYNVAVAYPSIVSSGVVRLSASVTNPENVRYVIFYVDNVPVGADDDYPYYYDWTSGTSEVEYSVTAVAYNLFASTDLSASSTILYTYGESLSSPTITFTSTSTTQTTATINFTSTSTATSTVYYGTTTSYGLASSSDVSATSHSITLHSLSAGTQYHFYIEATNASGTATSSDLTFTTTATDTTAPVISAVSSSTNPTTATITWTTDENSSSTVYYGETTSYGSASTSDTLTTSHSINLSGLSGYTTYHFYVESTDAYGNTSSSSDYTFLTTDTTAPTVTAFTIPATSSSQTITITTFTASDTGGSGLAGYLINETASTPSLSDPSWETSATTTYTFSTDGSKTLYAWAKDNSGNISNSSTDTITIDSTGPVISSVSSSTNATTATVTWTTDENATSLVQYGATTSYGSASSSATLSTSHSINISSLATSTAYHFRTISTDSYGNTTTSTDYTLTTSSSTATSTYTIGGTISGLSGTVVLQNNSTNDLSVTSNGSFTFSTALSDGASYSVTVSSNPSGQTCSVSSGTGTVSSANVTSVTVTCTTNPVTSSGGGGGGGGGGDRTAPIISAISTLITQTSATVNWTTNETSNSVVEYGTSIDYGSTFSSPTYTSTHSLEITGLTPNTTYHYRLKSTDFYANTATTEDRTLRTLAIGETATSTIGTSTQETTSTSTAEQGSQNVTSLIGASSATVEQVTKQETTQLRANLQFVPLTETEITIYNKMTAIAERELSLDDRYSIAGFIHYGTPTTKILGAGERAGSIASFKSAFGRMPKDDNDWQDVIKIGNGRWPTQRNETAEERAKTEFKKIYLRDANMDQANDNAAVTVMAYGLRPANRNMDSEKAAIKSFRAIYKNDPSTAQDWDIVRAIAYSGAKR